MKCFIRKIILVCLIVLFSLSIISCNSSGVKVGSKIDTEGALLGNMILLMLEANGIKTIDKVSLGPTNIVRKAITNGQIDIYPEYTGNGAFFFEGTDKSVWKNPETAHETVKNLDYEKNKIVWLTPAPANNTWAIAVREDLAKKENLESLEDMADYVNNGGYIKLIASEEFFNRPDVFPQFQSAYGFKLSNDQMLSVAGGNTAQTEKAAAQQTDGVNFAMAYGTDGNLSAFNLRVLKDTKGVQPVYEPAPIIREKVLEKYPEIEKILKPVFNSLDLETLQTLNAKISVEGINAGQVAKDYLKSKGFLK